MLNPNVGWRFPFRFQEGRVARGGGVADQLPTATELDDATIGGVQQVVLTGRGERPMLGQFGVGADRYLFMPVESLAMGLVSDQVREQLKWWCSRVTLQQVMPQLNPRGGEVTFYINLTYKNEPGNGVLKFTVRGLHG